MDGAELARVGSLTVLILSKIAPESVPARLFGAEGGQRARNTQRDLHSSGIVQILARVFT